MGDWANFFVAQVGASAALAGLVFVAISINLTKILSYPGLPERALAAVVVLLLVLIASSLVLVPGQATTLLGSEVLVVGLVAWGLVSSLQRTAFGKLEQQYRRAYTRNILFGQAAAVVVVLSGLAVLWRGADGLDWMVPGIVVCYLEALTEAWVLLIEINR